MRRLTKTLATVLLLAPASAYSLGIGSIKVRSGLNQNLNAEITLVTSAHEDISDIKVSLAPPTKFDEAKVPWSIFLSKLKFEPIVKANGSTAIKVSSTETLKEPYLDFLLEVSWPKGNLYRQFTILLEPPDAYHQTASDDLRYEHYEPAKPVASHERYTAETVRPKHRIIQASQGSNITKKHDTLWKVAERVKHDNESVEQMIIALYKTNPHAFYKNNINALLPNKKLNIPSKEEVLSRSQNQAFAEFNQHMQAWKNNAAIATHNASEAPEPEETTVTDKQLTLVAPTDASLADDTTTTTTPGNAKPEDKTVNQTNKPSDDKEQNPQIEKNVSVAAPNQETKTNKVAELESQLATIQKTLAQKEQELQALQPGNQTTKPESEQTSGQHKIEITTPVIKTPEIPQPPTQQPKVNLPPEEAVPSDSSYLWIVAIGGGLLALIGWLWWRKRKFEQQFDGESMFAPSSMLSNSTVIKPSTKDGKAYSAVATGIPEDNSFLNEFTASDFEVFDTSHVEIDPISETDVYLAYGRYQQAEELMHQAIKDHPNNDEYKLKLLEIFCATERKKDFVNYATELADSGKKDQAEFWAKVIEMGRETWFDLNLSANEELFSPDSETAVENIYTNLATSSDIHQNNLATTDDDFADSSFDVATFDSSFEESLISDAAAETFGSANTLGMESEFSDFDSRFSTASNTTRIDPEDELQNNDSIDFELDSFTSKPLSATNLSLVKESDSEENLDIESIDFDLTPKPIDQASDTFALDDLDLNSDDNTPFGSTNPNNNSGYSAKDFDFDIDFDLTTPEVNSSYFDQNDDSFDILDLDELETKLDLAKAYIDMGDSDAAKEIIAEVMEKGNAEQIKTARNLFDNLV